MKTFLVVIGCILACYWDNSAYNSTLLADSSNIQAHKPKKTFQQPCNDLVDVEFLFDTLHAAIYSLNQTHGRSCSWKGEGHYREENQYTKKSSSHYYDIFIVVVIGLLVVWQLKDYETLSLSHHENGNMEQPTTGMEEEDDHDRNQQSSRHAEGIGRGVSINGLAAFGTGTPQSPFVFQSRLDIPNYRRARRAVSCPPPMVYTQYLRVKQLEKEMGLDKLDEEFEFEG